MKKFKFHLKHLKKNGLIIVTAFLTFLLVNVCTEIDASAVSIVASKDDAPIAFQVHGQGKGDIALVFIHG